ncbi:hypothetical protein AYI69_g1539 [Smittium culicis]|uniref:CCHC-type domain-containing protein n=1 Tax=Smittium culicis TaxID=133412 RepID=A0A1R1YQ37_9FUNG|nr:hypothetical protein AYI69_g1539 [Smittium culicis]
MQQNVPIHITAEQVNNAEELLINKEAEITELRTQLIQIESQFKDASDEHHLLINEYDKYKVMYESESIKSAELESKIAQQENASLKREIEVAQIKAEYFRQISELSNNNSRVYSTNDNSVNIKNVSKVPGFEGKSITFGRWIKGVNEIFENYPGLKDFQKRALVVESLKGPARDWYDAEPDDNVKDWAEFKGALTRQYGSMESTDHALERIDTLRLTPSSDFNSFIQQIRPAIKVIALNNHTLAIAMLRKQTAPEIRKYIPKIYGETYEAHEQRLKSHMQDAQAKFTSTHPGRSNNMDVDMMGAAMQFKNSNHYAPQSAEDHEYALAAAQYRNYQSANTPRNESSRFNITSNRNPFQRSTRPHSQRNTTMTKIQFDEYVRNSTCFNCGIKGHLRSSCTKPTRPSRFMNSISAENETGKDRAQ